MQEQHVKQEYPLSEVTGRIIAAAMEVHRQLGPGFEEVIYQRALALELPAHSLECSREVWIDVHYKATTIGHKRVDLRPTALGPAAAGPCPQCFQKLSGSTFGSFGTHGGLARTRGG
jgi:hypothetical protein